MKKVVASILAMILCLSVFTFSTGEQEKITIGVTFMTLNSPFFEAMQRGVEEAAKAANVEVVISDAKHMKVLT